MNYFFTSKTSGTIINFGVHNSNLSSCILIPQAPFDYCLFVYTTSVKEIFRYMLRYLRLVIH